MNNTNQKLTVKNAEEAKAITESRQAHGASLDMILERVSRSAKNGISSVQVILIDRESSHITTLVASLKDLGFSVEDLNLSGLFPRNKSFIKLTISW